MSAMNELSKLAYNANSYLSLKLADYEQARVDLAKAHEDQSVAVRALAAVLPDADAVRRGQELDLEAVKALNLNRTSEGAS